MMNWKHGLHAVMLFGVLACGSSAQEHDGQTGCGPVNASERCECDDGRSGARVCRGDGSLSACECTGPRHLMTGGDAGGPPDVAGNDTGGGNTAGNSQAGESGESAENSGAGAGGDGSEGGAGGACQAADVAGCRCPDRLPSYRLCEDGFFGACHCQGASEPIGVGDHPDGTCLPTREICDQLDNDCDGLIDDGFPCIDDTVSHTMAPTLAAYVADYSQGSSCSAQGLHQVWPTPSDSPITVRACHARYYRIRRTDEHVFYKDFSVDAIFAASESADPVLQPTPPCNDEDSNFLYLGSSVDFDSQGVMHYGCKNALFRGDGHLVAGSTLSLAGVLDDGRAIVTRSGDAGGAQFAVVSKSGEELSRFPPPDFYLGGLDPLSSATSIEGDVAYVALARRYSPDGETARSEVVVYQLDADSIWRLVRRVEANWASGGSILVFADGTVLTMDGDPGSFSMQRVVEHRPDNTVRTAWRESGAGFDVAFDATLFAGPPRP